MRGKENRKIPVYRKVVPLDYLPGCTAHSYRELPWWSRDRPAFLTLNGHDAVPFLRQSWLAPCRQNSKCRMFWFGAEAARRANKKFRSAPHIDVAVGVNLGSGHLDSPQEERLMSFGSNSSCAESVGFSTMSSAAR